MKKQIDVVLAAGVLILLSACATGMPEKTAPPQPAAQITSEKTEPDRCGDLLDYYEALSAMHADELKQEERMLRENINHGRNNCDELRLAMLLFSVEAGGKSDREAGQILDRLLAEDTGLSEQEQQIARLISDQVRWRRKMRNKQQSLKQQLKKERDASLILLERLADTQSKLEQLKKIEININEREQEVSTPSTDKIPHEPK